MYPPLLSKDESNPIFSLVDFAKTVVGGVGAAGGDCEDVEAGYATGRKKGKKKKNGGQVGTGGGAGKVASNGGGLTPCIYKRR